MRRSLIALQDFSYATRRLKAGDIFEVDAPMAKVLVAIKKARAQREVGSLPTLPARLAQRVTGGDVTALRAEYFAKLGKRPYHGWDAAEIRRRMAEAGR